MESMASRRHSGQRCWLPWIPLLRCWSAVRSGHSWSALSEWVVLSKCQCAVTVCAARLSSAQLSSHTTAAAPALRSSHSANRN